MNCPEGHGNMRKTELGIEWKLKGLEVKVYVCDSCHGLWIEDGEKASKAIKGKVRTSYFAGER